MKEVTDGRPAATWVIVGGFDLVIIERTTRLKDDFNGGATRFSVGYVIL